MTHPWRVNLWPAVARVVLVSFSSLRCSRWFCIFVANFPSLPSASNWAGSPSLVTRAMRILLIGGIDWRGTGICGDEVCRPGNRRQDCGFARTGRRWLCGQNAPRRPQMHHPPRPHPSEAWVGHPLRPWVRQFGLRWGPLPWLPMLRAMGCRITTGFRDVPLQSL